MNPYFIIVESYQDAIILVDEQRIVICFNRQAENLFDCPSNDVIGQPLSLIIPDDDSPLGQEQIPPHTIHRLENPISKRLILAFGQRGNGIRFPVEYTISHGSYETTNYYIYTVRAFENNQAYQGLLKNNDLEQMQLLSRYRAIVNWVTDGFLVIDSEGRLIDWNLPALQMHGFSSVEDLGEKNTQRLQSRVRLTSLDEVQIPISNWPLSKVQRGESIFNIELIIYHRENGNKTNVIFNGAPIYNSHGVISQVVLCLRDVTSYRLEVANKQKDVDLLLHILEISNDMIYIKDQRGNCLYANPRARECLQLSYNQGAEHQEKSISAPLKQASDLKDDEIMISGHTEIRDKSWEHGDSIHYYITTKASYRDQTGKAIGVIGISPNINEVLDMEKRLHHNHMENRSSHCISQTGTWSYNLLNGDMNWSEETYQIFGIPANITINPGIFYGCILPADRQVVEKALEQACQGKNFDIIHRIEVEDQIRWVREKAEIQFNDSGDPSIGMGFVQDITEQKRFDAALLDSQRRLYTALDGGGACTWVWVFELDTIQWDGSLAKLFGWVNEHMIDRDWESFIIHIHKDDQAKVKEILESTKSKGGGCQLEFRFQRTDGKFLWISAQGQVAYNELGKPECLTGVCVDITERKVTEKHLASQWEISRILANAKTLNEVGTQILKALCISEDWGFGALWEVNAINNNLSCIGSWHLPSYHLNELAAKTRNKIITTEYTIPGSVFSRRRPLFIDSNSLATNFNCPRFMLAQIAGMYFVVAAPILFAGEILGVLEIYGNMLMEDKNKLLDRISVITSQIGQYIKRKNAQEEVQRILSCNPVILYAIRVDGDQFYFSWISDNIVNMTGYTAVEVLHSEWWHKHIHPDDHDRVIQSHLLPDSNQHQILEYRLRHRNGKIIWIRDEKRRLHNIQGNPEEIVGSWSDISDRVLLEEKLRQAQKMEAIGQLAGGVAHDFNNLLTVINGYSEMFLTLVSEDSQQGQFVYEIMQAGKRAANLTQQLLAFSRKQMLEPKIIDLNETIANIENMLHRLIGENINLITFLSPTIGKVKVDPVQIQQVLLNLAVNARDAMPDGGQLIIKTEDFNLYESLHCSKPELKPGRYVLLSLSDTGCGMAPEVVARIFEPFYTTKEVGKGTGLGLATVFGIVTQSDGHIEVVSAEGVGSCFKVYLPVIYGTVTQAIEQKVGDWGAQGGETIMLVEDEESVRQIAKISLEKMGYSVYEAENGEAALALINKIQGPWDMLLTDMVMPGMNGRQLKDKVLCISPDISVLYITGYIDERIVKQNSDDNNEAFLTKPFTPTSLVRKVREILDKKYHKVKLIKG